MIGNICGYRVQMWNKRPDAAFKFWIYRDNALMLASSFGALAAGIVATTF